mgnify:FL=1
MNKRKIILFTLLFLLLLFLVAVYYFYDPSKNIAVPKCVFLLLTGYKCPGCGSQRAISHLLHFNVGAAFKENMLLVLSIPLVVLLIYTELVRKTKSAFYLKVNSKKLIVGYFIVVVLWSVLRNVFGL